MKASQSQLALFDVSPFLAPAPITVHHAPPADYSVPGLSMTPEIGAILALDCPVAIGVSGGKDSSVAAIKTVEYLDTIGHRGERILIHADLGRIEWAMSVKICQQLADRLNVELVTVRRPKGDMVDRWLQRWDDNLTRYTSLSCVRLIMPWSSAAWRFCTSELKSAIIAKELVKRFPGRQIVSAIGIRGQESPARAKTPVSQVNKRLTSIRQGTSGMDWNPIFNYTEEQVWATHHLYGLPIHEAYSVYGTSRVSCSYCVLARDADLLAATACVENQEVYRELADLEIRSTFGFKENTWLGDIRPDLLSDEQRAGLVEAKSKAARREAIESQIPAHLLFSEGWPQVMPTYAEACLLAKIREQIGQLINVPMNFISAEEILIRYEKLIATNEAKKALKAIAEAKKKIKTGGIPPAKKPVVLQQAEPPTILDLFSCY